MSEKSKRLMLISAIVISLMALVVTEATARCRIVLAKLRCSDITAETFLQGVGNPDINDLAVCVSLAFDCEGNCYNKGGNAVFAEGVPFSPQVTICNDSILQAYMLGEERGTAVVDNICFSLAGYDACLAACEEDPLCDPGEECSTNCEIPPGEGIGIYQLIQAWVNEKLSDVCQNPNWTFEWGIEKVYAYYSTYQLTKKGVLFNSSELCLECDVVGEFGQGDECGLECTPLNTTGPCVTRDLAEQCYTAVEPWFFPDP